MKLTTSIICLIVWFGHTDSRELSKYSLVVGENVTLSCPERSTKSVTWYGPPKYTPYRIDGEINPELIDKNIAMNGNHSNGEYNLEIINVSYSNQGEYRCRLVNNDGPVEYEIFLNVSEKPIVVEEITGNHISYSYHDETTIRNDFALSSRHYDQPKVVKEITEDHPYHDNHDETTSSTNSGDRSWHNESPNESRFMVLCIVSLIAMLIIVTCMSICIRKYYRNKYRKQKPPDDDTTHNYDEIDSDLFRGVSKVDSQITTGNIAVNEINEDIIYKTSDGNTYTNELNFTNCEVQVSIEASLHVTLCNREIGAIAVYQNVTLTGTNDYENPYVGCHVYEPIGQVQVSTEDSIHVTHGKSETDAITLYENDTITDNNDPMLTYIYMKPLDK